MSRFDIRSSPSSHEAAINSRHYNAGLELMCLLLPSLLLLPPRPLLLLPRMFVLLIAHALIAVARVLSVIAPVLNDIGILLSILLLFLSLSRLSSLLSRLLLYIVGGGPPCGTQTPQSLVAAIRAGKLSPGDARPFCNQMAWLLSGQDVDYTTIDDEDEASR